MNKNLKLALSLDQTKIAALAFEKRPDDRPIAQAFCSKPTSVFSGSGVASLQAAADSLLEVIDEIEAQVKQPFYETNLTHSSPHCSFLGFTSLQPLGFNGVTPATLASIEEVSHQGRRALVEPIQMAEHKVKPTQQSEQSSAEQPPKGAETLYYLRHLPYVLDRETSTIDPLGLHAETLARGTFGFRDSRALLANISAALHLAGLKATSWIPQPLSSGLASTTPEERRHGVISVDLGARHTQIAVFRNDSLFMAKVIPYGGHHVTKDLAACIGFDLAQAESLKRTLFCFQEQQHRDVPEFAQAVAEARFSEILRLVRHFLVRSLGDRLLDYTVVLSGGASSSRGLLSEFKKTVHPLTRTNVRYGLRGFSDLLEDPALASLVGTTLAQPTLALSSDYRASQSDELFAASTTRQMRSNFLGKILKFLSGAQNKA